MALDTYTEHRCFRQNIQLVHATVNKMPGCRWFCVLPADMQKTRCDQRQYITPQANACNHQLLLWALTSGFMACFHNTCKEELLDAEQAQV